MTSDPYIYLQGFGNHFESEAVPGALVKGCNSPQQVPFNLYAEQLSGSAFTNPRHINLRSWLYRIRPSVLHQEFKPVKQIHFLGAPFSDDYTPPTQMRWNPPSYPTKPTDFINGISTFAGNGSLDHHCGAAIHFYCATQSMEQHYFYNADGEMLIVPQEGGLVFFTEFGNLQVTPGEIIVIPRGVKFQVKLLQDKARGYICENYGIPFRLPELGIIGANGLANARDFKIPTAAYEKREGHFHLIAKFNNQLWQAEISHSPLDVVAWHGNYTPYKYDLHRFNTINTVSFDHPDPSIFTVLTSPTSHLGTANVDFVIFPARWMVAGNTFRPPYFHRNLMSEYMGLIYGSYDAKEDGFLPGGSSLHNCMSAHGPDAQAYEKAINADLKPEYYQHTLAFMFESRQIWRLTQQAYNSKDRQANYLTCWQGLPANFESKELA